MADRREQRATTLQDSAIATFNKLQSGEEFMCPLCAREVRFGGNYDYYHSLHCSGFRRWLNGESSPGAEGATPQELPELVKTIRQMLEVSAGCTEEDCGCVGSALMNAVRESERQLAEVYRANQVNSAQNPSNARADVAATVETPPEKFMTDAQIKHMVDRFLGWRLPENFNPDGGISFKKVFNEKTPWPMKNEPTGTNLLDATQAEEMVRYMVEGLAGDPLQPATEERKEFEASVEFVGYEFNKISTGDYANRDTYHAFLGWAARSRRKTEG